MKVKTITIISVIVLLILALTFTAFARGKNQNLVKIQLDSNTYKKVEPAIKNLYDSLKNLINKEVSAGIITSYYAQSINANLDNAYNQITKTKTIYLPFFGGFGPRGPRGIPAFGGQQNPQSGQGPQNNQGGQYGNPAAGAPGYGQGFGQMYQNQLTEQQLQSLKSLTPEVLKVVDAESNFAKSLKEAGILTDLQYSTYVKRLENVKQLLNQVPMIHYGIMQFFILAGYEFNG
ncbi:MAG TPA: hypothetical protein PLF21_02785 [Exilispira sp.]|nr:hypothetical protein [Exilispira sp.]